MFTRLHVSDATGQRVAAYAVGAGCSIDELVDRALNAYEHARFWQQTREALAAEPGVELEDHDLYGPALKDGLDRP